MKNINYYKPALFLGLTFLMIASNLYGQKNLRKLNIKLTPEAKAQELTVEVDNGLVYLDRDIILGTERDLFERRPKAAIVTGSGRRWSNGIIPYFIELGHPRRYLILDAIKEVNEQTNLELVEFNTALHPDYVYFYNGANCSSSVGRQGGMQRISINGGGDCNSKGVIMHEICHAAGLYHEQNRQDRDRYVTIHWFNMLRRDWHNFQQYDAGQGFDFGPYDYNSIMHYPENLFSIVGRPTISIKSPPAPAETTIGSDTLSNGDIIALNTIYPCPFINHREVCGTFRSSYITSANILEASNVGCNTTIQGYNDSKWRAASQIILHPGVHIYSGGSSDFEAYINPCAPTPSYAQVNEDTGDSLTNGNVLRMEREDSFMNAKEAIDFKVYPNPFKSQTTIAFDLPEAMSASIRIYNTVGKAVHEIQNDFSAGYNETPFENTKNLPPGVYIVCLQAGDFIETKQVIISR